MGSCGQRPCRAGRLTSIRLTQPRPRLLRLRDNERGTSHSLVRPAPEVFPSGISRAIFQSRINAVSKTAFKVRKICFRSVRYFILVAPHRWSRRIRGWRPTMPISIRRQVIRASVVLVMAAIALGMAAIVSASVTAPVKAPQLSSTQTKLLFRGETDLWLRDHQQLRRSFFEQPRDRLK